MPVKVLVWALCSQRLLSFSLLLGTETEIVNVRPRLSCHTWCTGVE